MHNSVMQMKDGWHRRLGGEEGVTCKFGELARKQESDSDRAGRLLLRREYCFFF